jgi:hypothetical protein
MHAALPLKCTSDVCVWFCTQHHNVSWGRAVSKVEMRGNDNLGIVVASVFPFSRREIQGFGRVQRFANVGCET